MLQPKHERNAAEARHHLKHRQDARTHREARTVQRSSLPEVFAAL
jgi:hypothetical protein